MSAADRKVIHDVVAANKGVRSYSEGEAPRRYVVLAATDDDLDRDEQDLDELDAVPDMVPDISPVSDEPDQLEVTEELVTTEEDDQPDQDSPDE
jgi:hypothetical protein